MGKFLEEVSFAAMVAAQHQLVTLDRALGKREPQPIPRRTAMHQVRLILTSVVLGLVMITDARADGYLKSLVVNDETFQVPPPPDISPASDGLIARAVQAVPNSPAWNEAVADAKANSARDIVTRFSQAAGTDLSAIKTPILVQLLSRVIDDTERISQAFKDFYPRRRPYETDPIIKACYTYKLTGNRSYPSSQAMNGYAVALVLADLFPAQKDFILARGVLYGNNRVVCGISYPTDVDQGRILAAAYFEKLRSESDYVEDFQCAKAEEDLNAHAIPKLPDGCPATVATRQAFISQ